MPLTVRAVHTFVAEHGDELEFQAGEQIEVIEKDEAFGDGWWRGKNAKGEEGLFPMSYITESPPTPQSNAPALPQDHILPPSPEPGLKEKTNLSPPPTNTYAIASESPKGTASEGVFENVAATAAASVGAAASTVGNVMGKTIGDIQHAIESYNKPESDDDGELGIGQDTRARLAEQSKIANAQRENRASGAVAGLMYSDESDDEEEGPPRSLTTGVKGLSLDQNGLNGDGVHHAPVYISAAPVPAANDPTPSNTQSIPLEPIHLQSTPAPVEEQVLEPPLPIASSPPVNRGSDAPSFIGRPPVTWSVAEVVEWARSKGFDEVITDRFREHEISGDLLLELDANLLKELDIPQFGKRLRIAQAISELRRPSSMISSSSQQQLSPGMISSGTMARGMSAPPGAMQSFTATPTSTPPMSATEDGMSHSAWAPRKTSSITSTKPTTISAIREEGVPEDMSTRSSSMPSSPVTPGSANKRGSSGSIGHKKGKPSIDNKDRLSFFGRSRKAPPSAMSPGVEQNNGSRQQARHQMQPATPEQPRRTSGVAPGMATALQQIGKADYSGHLKKKGERYNTWKSRYFVLKGAHLYYMKSETEDRVKGHIDLRGHRVIVDENTNPGSYGFRLVGPEKPHYFSSSEQTAVREWMKALMKATIARDYSVPVTSSCNIPTIPLAEAQAMSPRPPSPAERDATQRATRRENVNQLTARDASVLMSLDTSSGQRRRASQGPTVPSRDTRRVSGLSNGGPPPAPSSTVNVDSYPRPGSGIRPSLASFYPADAETHADLVQWVNDTLPPPYPKASSLPESFVSGEVIFLLVKSLSGIEPNPPVAPSAFSSDPSGQPGIPGLFAMMDMLIDSGIDTAGVSLNEIRGGDVGAIVRLLKSVQEWTESRA